VNLLTVKAVKNCPFDEDAVLLRSSELTKLMVYAGFQDVESKFIIAVPPINSMLMKIDRAFCRIPLGAQYYVVAKRG